MTIFPKRQVPLPPRLSFQRPLRTRRGATHRRAFLLIELLILLLIFGAFALIFSEMTAAALHADHESRARDVMIHRLDNALNLLRRDIWSATALRSTDGRLLIEEAGGRVILWNWNDGTLGRGEAGLPVRMWQEMPHLSFEAHGPLVTLTVMSGKMSEHETFAGQQLMAGGAP